LKQDDVPWHLERLSAAEAPELCRAVDAAKQQLPSAHELAALAASLSGQGLPLPKDEPLSPELRTTPRLGKHWWLVGAAVLGASAISLNLARRPGAAREPATPHVSRASTEQGVPQATPLPAPGSPAQAGPRGSFASTPSTPKAAVAEEPAVVDAPPQAQPGPEPQAVKPNGPISPPVAPAAATPSPRPADSQRASQSSAAAARGASLGAGSKVQASEIELLRDARLALQSSPALALGLTEQHSAAYPHGTMVQERELIAISALARLGRHAAVLSRAQRFEHDFPGSPYRKQIAQLAK
jgi:hypothetical protein